METVMTHADLVKRAGKWLVKKGHAVVTTEVAGPESADAIGWSGTRTTLIECKGSRSDFLADAKKYFRRAPEQGMGDLRYYMCEADLIKPEELPSGWGLLSVQGRCVKLVKDADHQSAKCIRNETALLLSLLRRVGSLTPPGVSIKYYTYETNNKAEMYLDLIDPDEAHAEAHDEDYKHSEQGCD